MQKLKNDVEELKINTERNIKDYEYESDYFNRAYWTIQNRILSGIFINLLIGQFFFNKFLTSNRKKIFFLFF